MYLIMTQYKQPLTVVDEYLGEHRDFLTKGYEKGWLIVSGPRNPRDGGVMLSQLKDREQLENFLKEDPFYQRGIADFEIIEFNPVKYHEQFKGYI